MKKLNFIIIGMLHLSLISCNKDKEPAEFISDKSVFENGLAFQKIIDLPSNYYEDQSVGFLANSSNNSLYISFRNANLQSTETTYKLDVNSLFLKTKNVTISDFVTKRNYISNNKLYVFGSSKNTTYDLELNSNQTPVTHETQKVFSRFGFAVQNENAYIIGGFLGINNEDNKKIWIYNLNTSLFTVQATMDKNRKGGSSEIVNKKLYTFFGYQDLLNTTSSTFQPLNDILIYNFKNNDFITIPLITNVKVSFTAKFDTLIFVAGNKQTETGIDSSVNGSFFGYFDTTTNTMTEIPITVTNNSYSFPYICEIEIMNNKIYALVKNSTNTFSVQVANLK